MVKFTCIITDFFRWGSGECQTPEEEKIPCQTPAGEGYNPMDEFFESPEGSIPTCPTTPNVVTPNPVGLIETLGEDCITPADASPIGECVTPGSGVDYRGSRVRKFGFE